jgi:hypothetical protein
MTGMKISVVAAMRARDVSRPSPADEEQAALSASAAPGPRRPQDGQAARPRPWPADGSGPVPGRRGGRRNGRRPDPPAGPAEAAAIVDAGTSSETAAVARTGGRAETSITAETGTGQPVAGQDRAPRPTRPRVRRRVRLGRPVRRPGQDSGGSSPEAS